jgi:DNA-binding SARP family transcriptional activator
VVLELPTDAVVDVDVVTRGSWADAVRLPGLGAELLDGIAIQSAPAFEAWLLSEQRHIAAASEAILHEAALGSMSSGDHHLAIGYAIRAALMSPLDENHQALLIRLYRLTGDDAAAEQQFEACCELFSRELGSAPGPAVHAALGEKRIHAEPVDDPASVEAIVEAGSAAVAAGAVEAGVQSLRTAVRRWCTHFKALTKRAWRRCMKLAR